jgi:hypothetical protein
MFLMFGAVSVEWFVFSHEFNRILALTGRFTAEDAKDAEESKAYH